MATGILGTGFSPLLALPAVVLAFAYLLFGRVKVTGPKQQAQLKSIGRAFKGRVIIILGLFLIMVFRHGFIMTVGFFLAKMFADWGFSRLSYSFANTFFALSGAVGVLVSGIFAHRVSTKAIMVFSLTAFLPFYAAVFVLGPQGSLWLAFAALGMCGFILQLAHVPLIVLGHHMLPEGTSTISGIFMGFAWGFGRLSQPLVPAFSGLWDWAPGLMSGLIVLLALPAAALILTLILPRSLGRRTQSAPDQVSRA